MNTRAASFGALLISILISVDAQAVSQAYATAISAEKFLNACRNATHDTAHQYFTPEKPIGDQKHTVKVFTLRPQFTSPDIDILAMVEKGSDTDIEVPRITTVCKNNVPQPRMYGGNIEFPSKAGDIIKVRFHLLGLKHTTWKPAANDSVWMVEGLVGYPNANDWPACMQPKDVQPKSVPAKDIWFEMCSNTTLNNDLLYRYELILVQASPKDGAWVDVGIDPQIINHPH